MKNLIYTFLILLISFSSLLAQDLHKVEYQESFRNPPADCWPHTRWWWPGNPLSKEEITRQLEEMSSHGIKGVEQITMGAYYKKGNIPYMSEDYLEMAKHAVDEAKRLGMEVSFNFGGPGWIMGGDWVAEEDKSKDLIPTSLIVEGPAFISRPLSNKLIKTKRSWELYKPILNGSEQLLAVVAGRIDNGRIDPESLQVLTDKVDGYNLRWAVPEGKWQIMAFWLAENGHSNAVDHFNKDAMRRFCEHLGGEYKKYVGEEFGKTVESFFGDSFELPNLASGIYWSTGLLDQFKDRFGYDLVPYLPAIWWQVGEISPKIRYDVNLFLHEVGMDAFFETFMNWCDENGMKGRVQTYGFSTDNIEAAGRTHIPEMEITAGEKDAMDWFDTRIGPKKYVASGAHIYGRKVVSVEAYTFIHWERFRATLEELKIASDVFLKNGATKFYNHGFSYSPERQVAPSRTTPWAAYIHPNNVWWDYYPKLAEYIARSSWMLRQGEFVADIAVYSPLANQWTKDALNARKWTREFDWGELGKLIVSNGYDFDLINDDALQNMAQTKNGELQINKQSYKILILPNIEALPLATYKFVEKFVKNGGTVIALERLPEFSTGYLDYSEKDAAVQGISEALFDQPRGRDAVAQKKFGEGTTYHIKQVLDRSIWWDKRSSTLDPFVNTIRKHVNPDFGIDFAMEGLRKNNGLTYQHRKVGDSDVYFITNIQDQSCNLPIVFRVQNTNIECWDPYAGNVSKVAHYRELKDGIEVPLQLDPYASTFLVFHAGEKKPHISHTNLENTTLRPEKIEGYASLNGTYHAEIKSGKQLIQRSVRVDNIPAPYEISGAWTLSLQGEQFPEFKRQIQQLHSWTKDKKTQHFSGTGRYSIQYEIPDEYLQSDIELYLDPGKIGNIAEIILNEKSTGTVWMSGQKVNITEAVKSGINQLEIRVTNTLINRISAYSEPVPVPDELYEQFGDTPDPPFLPREFGFEPLPASGLLGPVRIVPYKKVEIKL